MTVPTTNQSLMHAGDFFFFKSISSSAVQMDYLFYFIYALSVLVFVGIIGALIYFVVKYRRRDNHQIALTQVSHNNVLEIVWSVIPLLLVGVIFVWGYASYIKNVVPPENAKEMQVLARKWSWTFIDPATGIRSTNELVVPVNQPIRLIMSPEDVIHSLFIPNLRLKQDVLPNHYTSLSFTANAPGRYQIFCAEYCGDGHSKMLADLNVLTAAQYTKWQADQIAQASAALPLDQLGKKIATDQGCFSCHSVDGSKGIGPSWKGIYGQTHALVGGRSVPVDDNYIRKSVTDPGADVVAGFSPIMPTFAGKLSDQDMAGIIAYIRTLK